MTCVTVEQLADIISERGNNARSITAIAGPPGAGKSTVVGHLVGRLNASDPGSAALLPMDGYHFDDMVLRERGLLAMKGAPETFDTGGLLSILSRLKRSEEAEIAVPVFDRSNEIARAAARIIPFKVRHVLVEGNYLLLDNGDWSKMHDFFDTTVMLEVPEIELRRRLEDRWKGLSEPARHAKLEGNDLPNGRLVLNRSVTPEFVLKN